MSKHIIMGDTLSFTTEGKMYNVERRANLGYDNIVKALQAGNYAEAVSIVKAGVEETSNMKIKGNYITMKGTGIKLGPVYVDAYLYAKHLGKGSEEALDLFFTNVASNPDPVSRDGLSDFLAISKMPITDRGTFLAYRYVNERFYDCHTNTMDNMIGNDISMDRNLCDSNPNADCSRGLHAAHHEYVKGSGAQVLVMEINPRDVVAVPSRYDARKMRCCRFRPLCTLPYFKEMLLQTSQAALGGVPFFLTEQTRSWHPQTGVPDHLLHRYNPVDAWEWAAR